MKTSQALSSAKKLKSLMGLKKSELDAFGHVLIGNGRLTGFNGNSTISVPFLDGCRSASLSELIRSLELHVQLEGDGQATLDLLKLKPAETEFSEPKRPTDFTFQFEADLEKLAGFASGDDTRWVMTSIYFDCEKNRLVTTNGHILAYQSALPSIPKGDMSIVIPIHDVRKTHGLTTVLLGSDGRTLRLIDVKGTIQTILKMDAHYPNYRAIVDLSADDVPKTTAIDPALLVKAAKFGVTKIKGTELKGITLSIGAHGLKVDGEILAKVPFTAEIAASYDPQYLLTCAEFFQHGMTLTFVDSTSPLRMSSADRYAMIMPLKFV